MARQKKLAGFIEMLLDGEEAGKEAAGEELRRWADGFEAWVKSMEAAYQRKTVTVYRRAWADYLSFIQKEPWKASPADLEAWADQLRYQGLAINTIIQKLGAVSKFYDFMDRMAAETEGQAPAAKMGGEKGRNPARIARRPKRRPYDPAIYMSVEEARALLGAIDRETSIVGKRDYALILAHLMSGEAAREIRCLKFSTYREMFASTRDRQEAKEAPAKAGEERAGPWRLSAPVLEAIEAWLRAAGRWETIEEDEYIFTPLRDPLLKTPSGKAEDWNVKQPITRSLLFLILKRYARAAGLDEDLIGVRTLRHTWVMLRVEAGDEAEQLQGFLKQMHLNKTREYLKRMITDPKRNLFKAENKQEAIQRGPHRWEAGNQVNLKHGMYASRLPEEELEEARQYGQQLEIENCDPLKEDAAALRVMIRRTLEYSKLATTLEERIRLLDILGLAAQRLAKVLLAQQKLGKGPGGMNRELEELVKRLGVEG